MTASPFSIENKQLSVEDFGRYIELKDKKQIEMKSRSYSYIDSEGNTTANFLINKTVFTEDDENELNLREEQIHLKTPVAKSPIDSAIIKHKVSVNKNFLSLTSNKLKVLDNNVESNINNSNSLDLLKIEDNKDKYKNKENILNSLNNIGKSNLFKKFKHIPLEKRVIENPFKSNVFRDKLYNNFNSDSKINNNKVELNNISDNQKLYYVVDNIYNKKHNSCIEDNKSCDNYNTYNLIASNSIISNSNNNNNNNYIKMKEGNNKYSDKCESISNSNAYTYNNIKNTFNNSFIIKRRLSMQIYENKSYNIN